MIRVRVDTGRTSLSQHFIFIYKSTLHTIWYCEMRKKRENLFFLHGDISVWYCCAFSPSVSLSLFLSLPYSLIFSVFFLFLLFSLSIISSISHTSFFFSPCFFFSLSCLLFVSLFLNFFFYPSVFLKIVLYKGKNMLLKFLYPVDLLIHH